MNARLIKLCSIVLTLVMLFNMLPHQVLADTLTAEETELPLSGISSEKEKPDVSALDVVEEVTEKRTEFSKEFKMSNGLHMAAVYGSAVHYEDNGTWKEIDNTLVATLSGTDSVYTNSAGVWNISFPQDLSSNDQITVTKDGYTLRFGLAGQLSGNGAVVMNEGAATMSATDQISSGTLSVQEAQTATAQVQQIDSTALRADADHPETVADKLTSRLQYSNVYSNTNVIYDLQSNTLKESILINSYDSNLRGYRYTLDVGTMIPVLNEDNSIWFYDSARENVVMAMPAPFMVDAENVYNHDVEVVLQGSGSAYTLLYLLPAQWLAEEDRAWPVILDPVITADLHPNNIRDISVAEYYVDDNETGTISCGYAPNWGIIRSFVKYAELPPISSSDVIVSASMEMVKYGDYKNTNVLPVEAHKVLDTWDSIGLTWSNMPDTNDTVEDFSVVTEQGYYYWDVTDIVRDWYEGENTGMMFKTTDEIEDARVSNWKEFYSSDYGLIYRPTLVVYFRNNNGLESYWDYTASSAGRAGTGYVNNYTGNLVWVHNDIGFGGNRMPVSISHVYNANDSQSNTFGMGYGWRTNFNQRVYQWSQNSNYYVWEDSDGTDHYFYKKSSGTYVDEDGLELTLTTTGSGTTKYCISDKNGNQSYFDTYGRLAKQQNNQATVSSINVTYTTTSGYLISKITDGVGRVYNFTYSGGLLSRISYKGTGTDELSYVTFGYSSSKLTSITNADGGKSQYGYSGYLLTSATDIDGYKLTYTYTAPVDDWQPYRVRSVKETDDGVDGGEISIQYDHNQTTFTDHNGNQQIIQFNNWGNTIAIQDGEGRAQYARYATDSNPNSGKGNQLNVASKLQNTVGNILPDNSFELGTKWTASGATVSNASGTAYYGNKALKVVTTGAGGAKTTFTADPGKTYTFSAYVKTGNSAAYLTLGGTSSETLAANSGWTRLEVSYTNESSTAKSVTAQIMNTAAGTTYMDCVQLELAPTASRYNLIVNGDFRDATAWSASSGRTTGTAAAPQLSTNVYKLSGTYTTTNRISQTVNVSGSKGDTFVLAGWAKGNAAPLTQFSNSVYDSSDREFAIIAVFTYTDGTKSDELPVRFNPDVDNWQYAAAPIVAPQAYSSITIYLAYDYNVNAMLFDGIQLYKEQFGNSYTYDENGNVVSVVDLQKQTTTYEYDTNNNLTKMLQDNVAKMTYTYDSYHNVLTATSAEGLSYAFTYDAYGNNTSVSITSGGATMTSSAIYTEDGNRLYKTIDAANNETTYDYDANTNVLRWVQYPNDTDTTWTGYEYDDMYRVTLAKVHLDSSNLTANYAYENDLLKSITTGSTTYNFAYGNFGLRSSIKVGSTTLASYTYTARNNYLQTLAYGNGDSVQYTYDDLGRVTKETYEDGDTVTYAYDNDGALATVDDSATDRKTTYYYDFTDRLMKYAESGSGFNHSVGYTYDDLNNLTALKEVINGTTRTTSYAYDDDNRVTSITTGNAGKTYTYDGFGRVSKRVTKHGSTTVATDTITYRTVNGKATGQVSNLQTKVGAYTYTYDGNGNIKTVKFDGNTTTYTYDKANQLTREDNQAAGKTWVWTYDNAGNITSRKEYAYTTGTLGTALDTVTYTYGNTNWGDLLTTYDGQAITYDGIGNPLTDGTWTYTWEHGRELACMSALNTDGTSDETTINYIYDANGMRTQMTVTTNKYHTHEYTCTITSPTCTTAGYTTYTCTCGASYVDNETSATGHSYSSVVTAPTCTTDGYTTYTCSVCGYSYVGNETSATGHSYSETIVESTCTESGYTVYTCTVCGHSYQGNTTAETGHTYVSTVTAPTCTQEGYTTHTCSVCGHSYQDNTTDALGHDYRKAAPNETVYTCIRCGDSRTETGSHAHNYVATVLQEATCTEHGYTIYECDCGEFYDEVTEPLGHIYSHYPVTLRDACTRCGYSMAGSNSLQNTPVTTSNANIVAATSESTERILESTTTEVHEYFYTSGELLREVITTTTTTADGETTTTTDTLDFFYDASGTPMSVEFDGTNYYYVTNLQGDVVALLNSSGSTVVTYTYDAWGNILTTSGSMASTLGAHNPLRYRGYVYDTETGLYYLQSRYYDPAVGRFINADSLVTTGNGMASSNMFAYCLNNPVNGCDPCGTCFHRLDFWKDCERCAGKTWDEKLNILAADIYDYATDVYDAHMMQIESQQQIDQMQFDVLRDSTTAVWDAYVHTNELQAQAQHDHDMEVISQWEDAFRSPARTGDFAFMTIGNISAYSAYCGIVSAPVVTFGGVVGAGLAIAGALWTTLRYYEIIAE